ncbi:hypothetical protein [Kitasatospora sp. NPDC058190]|uniref:hypothetical protein n=1 Tax=Kitasatospora sp. NPDC058190 TaxID=3346371 RepID=UPI0036DA9AC2
MSKIMQPQSAIAQREAVSLVARTVQGSAVQGKASPILEAVLTNVFGEGIGGQDIHFFLTGTHADLGSVSTNPEGVARFDVGSHISDIQSMLSGAFNGYTAEYGGSRNYRSATAHGNFNVTI